MRPRLDIAALVLASVPGAGLALATGSVPWTLLGTGLGVGLGWGLLAWAARAQAVGQEKLLRSVVEGAPMAILLYGDSGHIAFTNAAARELFFEGRTVEGQNFLSMLQAAPAPLRQALLAQSDELFTVEVEGESETFHLSKRDFDWSGEPHTLLLVKHLTHELARQEVDVWKKVIRVMSHELNNSLAPLSSLLHSARLIAQNPEQLGKLARVLDLLEERATHLRTFLDGYARFARLPRPQPAVVEWSRLLAGLQALYPHATFAPPPSAPGWFDPAQVEQVLINLLKNAQEAGGAPESVALEVEEAEGGIRLRVRDRGRGLSPEVLQHALLPFYTTKEKGSGLGLALCREIIDAHHGRLRLENREGGGATVTVWLPGREAGNVGQSSRARLTMTRS
ncbi:MAG TPA: ATP-binding protein [Archangium sp.]|jgi:nitrogen fixation/metabolism regulation signal transduction histidine kinase|uniref:sensor histidine kinase n=1 Tax=Archangium sp. TaxID=1872627 RepID=UPI002ED9397C